LQSQKIKARKTEGKKERRKGKMNDEPKAK
jgi:hypothetical protein